MRTNKQLEENASRVKERMWKKKKTREKNQFKINVLMKSKSI